MPYNINYKYLDKDRVNSVFQLHNQFLRVDNSNPNDIPFRTPQITNSKRGIPEIKKSSIPTWEKDFIFLGLSIIVGFLTEGLGDIVFAGLLASTEISEGVATIIAGSTQTFFEIGGQLSVNYLEGKQSLSTTILTVLPGFGVFGLNKVAKGISLLKNEKSLTTNLLKQGVSLQDTKQIIRFTKEISKGSDLSETILSNSIQEGNVNAVRTFKEKIQRASGLHINKRFSNFYRNQSIKYGHEVVDNIPELINKRINNYNPRWLLKSYEQLLIKWLGKKWVSNRDNQCIIENSFKAIEQFKKRQQELKTLKENNFFNKYINKKIKIPIRNKVIKNTDELLYSEIKWFSETENKWLFKKLKPNENIRTFKAQNKIKKSIIKKVYKKEIIKQWDKREIGRIDLLSKGVRKLTNPLSAIAPTNLIRKSLNYSTRKLEKYAEKLNWYKRLTELLKKKTSKLRKIDSAFIKRYGLYPAIDSPWQIGFKIINNTPLTISGFYRNNANDKITNYIRELTPIQFERMLYAFESGNAGEFYNRELAYGWGLKKSWVNEALMLSANTIKFQNYLYTAYKIKRSYSSSKNYIMRWENGYYKHYDWTNNLKQYAILRSIRQLGRITGLSFITAGLGVALYRKNGWKTGLANSFTRRVRTSIKRYKRKPYHNPRKSRKRVRY